MKIEDAKEIMGYIGVREKPRNIIKNLMLQTERWLTKTPLSSLNITKKIKVTIKIEEV